MKGLLGKLWNNTFHLEGKFLRTAWQLFVPGLVTREFFKGKQDRYPHPIRLFGIVMFFFLLMLNHLLNTDGAQQSGLNFTVNDTEKSNTKRLDTKSFFKQMQQQVALEDFRKNYPALPAALRTPHTRQAVDSLSAMFARQHGQADFLVRDTMNDTLRINLVNRMIVIPTDDIVRYEPEELLQRLAITNWLERIVIGQSIKSFKSPESLGHAYIGSLTWTLLAIITSMAVILSLLYRRQRRYYVEHFIFLLHFHTGALLLLTLDLLLVQMELLDPLSIVVMVLLIGGGMFFALYRYYGQGIGKTLLKWIIVSIFYLLSAIVFFILGLLLVFAIY